MFKPANVTRLSPLQRGFLIGYRRARYKAREELHATAAHWEAEIADLQHDFHEIALELHRDRYDRALDEAIVQRATSPDALLHYRVYSLIRPFVLAFRMSALTSKPDMAERDRNVS